MSYDLDSASGEVQTSPVANGDLNIRLQELRYQRAQAAALVDIAHSLRHIRDYLGSR